MSCRKMGGDLERLGATSSSTVYARCAHDAHPDLGLDGTPNTLGPLSVPRVLESDAADVFIVRIRNVLRRVLNRLSLGPAPYFIRRLYPPSARCAHSDESDLVDRI